MLRLALPVAAGAENRGRSRVSSGSSLNKRDLLAGLLLLCGMAAARAQTSDTAAEAPRFLFDADDVASPEGLPDIGRWMVAPDGTVSHWLGGTYQGRHIREPINVIFADRLAASEADAAARLVAALAAAGYPSREGHSGGYRGFIGGQLYGQLPKERAHAFSNSPFEFNNNHGRIFGPAPLDEGYLFIGAFSRERVAPFESPRHQYESFDRARDDVTQRLDAHTAYRIAGFVDLGNAIIGDPLVTTGDHDGRAILMRLQD